MAQLIEISSAGYDEYIQGIGSSGFREWSSFGLRVPTLPTPDANHRYLFLLASFSLGEGETSIIRGYRQFSSIGWSPGLGRFYELEIASPNWRLPDGNISWHLRQLGGPNAQGIPRVPNRRVARPPPSFANVRGDGNIPPDGSIQRDPPTLNRDLPSFKEVWADGPCLLYEDYDIPDGNRIYTQLTRYVPPTLGRPYGTSIQSGHQPTFYDQRAPWRAAQAWSSLNMRVDGPSTIAFFASVHQSAGQYDVASPPFDGLPQEEKFIANHLFDVEPAQRPIYWRVGGALILEVGTGIERPQ